MCNIDNLWHEDDMMEKLVRAYMHNIIWNIDIVTIYDT